MSESTSPITILEPQKVVFGIDLGTLWSRAAIIQHKEDGSLKSKVIEEIPSIVSFTQKSKCLVGLAAESRTIASASNTFRLTKCLIGRYHNDPEVQRMIQKNVGFKIFKSPHGHARVLSTNFHQIFTPSQIAALILVKLKELCETKLNVPMKNVVITTPAYFTDAQVQATREAAQMAGLNVLKIMNEPTAAFLACNRNETDSKTVVVYDFGGTFKVSVLEIRNGKFEVKSTVSDLFLGGDNFDDVLIKYFVTELKSLTGADVTQDILTMQRLKKTAENAKIDLSFYTKVDIKFYIIRINGEPECKILKLTRTKFEKLIAKFVNKTKSLCRKVLEDAKVSVSDIDEVFAVGGIAAIPKVQATVQKIFGMGPYCWKLVDAVAIGAAYIGNTLGTNITYDNTASVEISPHLPKPAKQTEKFNFNHVDGFASDCPDQEYATILSTGICAILTEEEADDRIIEERKSQNRMDNGDVNFILAYRKLISLIRRNNFDEGELPDEIQKDIDYIKKGRDKFVNDELRLYYTFPSRRRS